MGKKDVIVTRIDEKGIEWAKQFFSCVHFNAGWKGDLLLLTHNIPNNKLKCFYHKGIIIKKCKPLYKVGVWKEYSASKLYIFNTWMKRWKTVICLDVDTIIRGSLDELTKINGFAAVPEANYNPLYKQLNLRYSDDWQKFLDYEKISKKTYNLSHVSFNGGVLVFKTSILNKNTFNDIEKVLYLTKNISKYADQTVLNLYFYKKWNKLPTVYNFHPLFYHHDYGFEYSKCRAIILHFAGLNPVFKPWHPKNTFNKEWRDNYKKYKYINRDRIPKCKNSWSKQKIIINEVYLSIIRLLFTPRNVYKERINIFTISIRHLLKNKLINILYSI